MNSLARAAAVGQGRDLFPSEEWIDLDGVLEKSYPAPAEIVVQKTKKKKRQFAQECPPALNEQTLKGLLRTLRIAKVRLTKNVFCLE